MTDKRHFDSDTHALFSGGVLGHLAALGAGVQWVNYENDHTPFFDLTLPPLPGESKGRVMRLQVMPSTDFVPYPQYGERYGA